ncbi:MAG: hypothetical protein ABSB61_06515 [Anaerolineales bacterium]
MTTRTDDAIRAGDAVAEAFTDCVELMARFRQGLGEMSPQLKQQLEREDPEGCKAMVELTTKPELGTEVAETLRLIGTWEAMSPQQKQHFKHLSPDAYEKVEGLARAVQKRLAWTGPLG